MLMQNDELTATSLWMELKHSLEMGSVRGHKSLIGLDFDGTLSPLVRRPGQARISDKTRSLLRRLAAGSHKHVAIVSGRGLEDVRSRIALPGAFYAGNHGLEIRGPGLAWTHPQARDARPRIEALARTLNNALRDLPGVLTEDKGLTLSVHHRMASASTRRAGRRIVAAAVLPHAKTLALARGKKVWEVRPKADWNKGYAILKIARSIGAAQSIIFIGDDRTDEEGFATLRGRAVTVRVGPAARTSARHYLDSQGQVDDFLKFLCGAQ